MASVELGDGPPSAFKPGDWVRCIDAVVAAEKLNNHIVVVVHTFLEIVESSPYTFPRTTTKTKYLAVEGLNTGRKAKNWSRDFQPRNIPDNIVKHLSWNKLVWLKESLVVPAEIQQNHFQIMDLPVGVLGIVLVQLPIGDVGKQSLTCKRFLEAFNDNAAWSQRCLKEAKGIPNLDEEFRKTGSKSWMEFYQNHATWKIEIVTIFHHSGGTSISGKLTVFVSPGMLVKDFLQFVWCHERNEQPPQNDLQAHDPALLGSLSDRMGFMLKRRKGEMVPEANCKFDMEALDKTLQEAGLCNGAILQQNECLMRD